MSVLINYPQYTLQDILFTKEVEKRGYFVEIHEKWEAKKGYSVNNIRKLGKMYYDYDNYNSTTLALDFTDGLVLVAGSKKNANIDVHVQAKTSAIATAILNKIKKAIPQAPEPMSDEISVRFWYLTNNGPVSVHRNIAAPKWDAIDGNYAANTKSGLGKLMSFEPSGGGQLILWHGEPGTGKSYALRALCQAWREWCSVEYIMDPEALLGASGYLASMIMEKTPTIYNDDDDDESESKTWKLLILEDTGELLTEHARGQALSRLLNVADGFIGQGLRVILLITTNEDFYKLHPAVSREGRCAASIKFNPLSEEESIDFLIAKGYKKDVFKEHTLADLFALIKEQEMPRDVNGVKKHSLGFSIPSV